MVLECINAGSNKSIKKGNVYEVISETENRYSILNDKGIQKNYSKTLFKEEKKEIVVVNEINAETSVSAGGNSIDFHVEIKIEGFENFVDSFSIGAILDTDISCGIKQISGVDDIMRFFNVLQEDFNDFIVENNININEDIDKDEFFKEIVASLFQDFLAEFESTSLYLLMSTNITENEDYNQFVIDELDNISETTELSGDNPNSGNTIKLWVLQCN